jgi:shikimate kinase/3-dehydroquinate synthase
MHHGEGGGQVSGSERVVLIGFSGTGKSIVARLLAERLGRSWVDTDDEIERRLSMTVPEVFRDLGEPTFRATERAVLFEALRRDAVVVATGGGAVATDDAWGTDGLGRAGTLVIGLDAKPATILDRLRRQTASEGEAVERPLLAADDPLRRIAELMASRSAYYDRAHLTLATDRASVEEIADELASIVRAADGQPFALRLDAASGSSDIQVGPGIVARIGDEVRSRWPVVRRAWIVTDAHVGPLHAGGVVRSLEQLGLTTSTHTVEAGEGSKSLHRASELYDWLLGGGVERGDVVVALGGGVVGDLAGYVAATVLRGIGLVQVPTSLLAAVDSSVGGKTGINHAAGKNLIGAFYQPPLVLADTALLRTMPARELRSGWAEVVKHAVIQRSTPGGERGDLATVLERNSTRLLALEEPATAYLVWRNIALKAAVVAADERESGIRAYLNFGHTLGHAIEAADYQLLHGEAVALGMRAAAALGVRCGTCGTEDAERIGRLLDRFDLPRSAPLDETRVLGKLGSDKKRIAGRQRYILPVAGGGVVSRDDVLNDAVRDALATVSARVAI